MRLQIPPVFFLFGFVNCHLEFRQCCNFGFSAPLWLWIRMDRLSWPPMVTKLESSQVRQLSDPKPQLSEWPEIGARTGG